MPILSSSLMLGSMRLLAGLWSQPQCAHVSQYDRDQQCWHMLQTAPHVIAALMNSQTWRRYDRCIATVNHDSQPSARMVLLKVHAGAGQPPAGINAAPEACATEVRFDTPAGL